MKNIFCIGVMLASVGCSSSLHSDIRGVKIVPSASHFKPLSQETIKTLTEEFMQRPEKLLMAIQDSNHPLHGLDECVDSSCHLNRLKSPNVRDEFVHFFLEKFYKKYPDRSKRIQVLFFASGKSFNECEILTRLEKAGYTSITGIFIDPMYAKDIAFLKGMRNHYPTKDIEELFSTNLENRSILKLITWFSQAKNYELIFYDSVANYVDDCEETEAVRTSDMIAIDYIVQDVSTTMKINLALDLLKRVLLPGGSLQALSPSTSRNLQLLGTIQYATLASSLSPDAQKGRDLSRIVLRQNPELPSDLDKMLAKLHYTVEDYKKYNSAYMNAFTEEKPIMIARKKEKKSSLIAKIKPQPVNPSKVPYEQLSQNIHSTSHPIQPHKQLHTRRI